MVTWGLRALLHGSHGSQIAEQRGPDARLLQEGARIRRVAGCKVRRRHREERTGREQISVAQGFQAVEKGRAGRNEEAA